MKNEVEEKLPTLLPTYMTPTAIVALDELPLTSSGKPDRMRLSRLDWARERGVFVAPEGKVEEDIALVWQEVLALDTPVGRSEEFLTLGGTSVTMILMLAKAQGGWGYPSKYVTCKRQAGGLPADCYHRQSTRSSTGCFGHGLAWNEHGHSMGIQRIK